MMGKPTKLAIGIASIIPFVYIVLFFGAVAMMMLTTFQGPGAGKAISPYVPAIFLAHFAVILLSLGLLAFYIVYIFKTDRIPENRKALWAIVIFMGYFVAMPIFWYLHIWREPVKEADA